MGPTRFMRTSLRSLAAVAALALGGAAQAAPGWCESGTPVRFAGVTWKSGQFYTELARAILEKGYGCKTEVVDGSTTETEQMLVDHKIQVWMEQWGGSDVVNRGLASGRIKLVGDVLEGGGLEGWFVPEFVVKGDPKRKLKALAPDLKSVDDLPRYKHLFQGSDDGGKGTFLSCPVGWVCEADNNQKMKAYGLTDSYASLRPATGAVLDMLIASALVADKPVLFYYWSPAALMGGDQRFIQLQEPAHNDACWKTINKSTVAKPCGSASPRRTLAVGVAVPFAQQNPELMRLLEQLRLPAPLLNRAVFRMTERKNSGAFEANEFLVKHPALWRAWVSADAAARLSQALR